MTSTQIKRYKAVVERKRQYLTPAGLVILRGTKWSEESQRPHVCLRFFVLINDIRTQNDKGRSRENV